jgi:ABC-type lipoprotein export system ATPase subunit
LCATIPNVGRPTQVASSAEEARHLVKNRQKISVSLLNSTLRSEITPLTPNEFPVEVSKILPNCFMPSSAPLLTLSNVTRRYESPAGGNGLTVLDGISLQLERGQSLAIVGPSGSGKSTLLQIIGTLDRPTSGTVQLDGQDLNQLDEVELAAVRNRKLGFVFQFHYLLPQCTVLENVLVPTLAKVKQPPNSSTPTPTETIEVRANRLLKRVGLVQRLNHRPGELSGGERQRVAVVRALINRPALLLADEPTGSLDHASAQQLGQLLVELNREEGVTLIVVTHARELAEKMGKRFELKDGKLN